MQIRTRVIAMRKRCRLKKKRKKEQWAKYVGGGVHVGIRSICEYNTFRTFARLFCDKCFRRARERVCVEEQNKNRETETNEGEMCLVGGETKTKTIF